VGEPAKIATVCRQLRCRFTVHGHVLGRHLLQGGNQLSFAWGSIMGTEITLEVAGLTVTYSKNFIGMDHGSLFQEQDRKPVHSDQIDYDYFKESGEDPSSMEMAFVRKLKDILPRLDLLGFTDEQFRLAYMRAVDGAHERYGRLADVLPEDMRQDIYGDEVESRDIMSFDECVSFVAAHPIETLDNTYDSERSDEQSKGRFLGDPTVERLPSGSFHSFIISERNYFSNLVGFLHPYFVLRLLGGCKQNLEADVVWQYGPLLDAAWAEENEFMPCAKRSQTFLVATEGSSDAHIFKHAISIVCREVDDFFRFIDVKEGHPFPGAGSLVKFAEGLAKIDVHNQIVFLLDNDAEGFDAWRRIQSVSMPANMRAIMLPELEEFRSFSARGPDGVVAADINRRAAGIECYLDLNYGNHPSPQVTWTNFKKELGLYHGALDNKESYTKEFLRLTAQDISANGYKLNKLRAVLDHLVAECSSIAVAAVTTDYSLDE
jgi:hypothetical protein